MENRILKYSDITEKVIGEAFAVHSYFGNGFQELIYQRALKEEFERRGLGYVRELEMPIFITRFRWVLVV